MLCYYSTAITLVQTGNATDDFVLKWRCKNVKLHKQVTIQLYEKTFQDADTTVSRKSSCFAIKGERKVFWLIE